MLTTIRANMLIGEYETALQALQHMMVECEQRHDYKTLTECYAYCAMIHYNNRQYNQSFEMTNYYESLCSRYELPIVKAHYYPLIGVQYMLQHDYEEALRYFAEAASDAQARNDHMLYSTSQKMIVACLRQQQQWGKAAHVLEVMIRAQHDTSTVEYAEWRILQLALLDSKEEDERFLTLSTQLMHHPILHHARYTRTRDYFEQVMVQFWTKRAQWERLCEQYEAYISYRSSIDRHDDKMEEIFASYIDVAQRISDEYYYGALTRYADHLQARQADLLEQAVVQEDKEDLLALIHKDALTGCYTRHYLEETMQAWLNETAVTIAVFDCDHFKQVNDTYGHLAGDAVLKMIVNVIEPTLPTHTFLARYGGDEFVLATKGTIEQCIDAFTRVHQQTVKTDAGEITASISMGIATSMEHESFELLFAVADGALYEAKRAGRGCYVIAGRK